MTNLLYNVHKCFTTQENYPQVPTRAQPRPTGLEGLVILRRKTSCILLRNRKAFETMQGIMMTKTPLFDAALDKVLANLKPHSRICEETGAAFEVDQRMVELCHEHRVPVPKKVWWARIRHLESFFAGFELFRHAGTNGKSTVSMFDPESFMPILPKNEWYADAFDPFIYARSIDVNQSFFDQWRALTRVVPRPSIIQDPKSENSDWCLYSINLKNCYFNHLGINNENILYCDANVSCKDCVSVSWCFFCEGCYDCIGCHHCSRVFFSEYCWECINVLFSRSCYNCSDCFGCVNLKGKRFCFFNQQLTEQEYHQRLASIDLSDDRVANDWRNKAQAHWNKRFRLGCSIKNSVNAFGDDNEDSRDIRGIAIRSCERVYDTFAAIRAKDSWTNYMGIDYERCYNGINCCGSYQAKMSNYCESCIYVEYCELLTSCEHCFGCIGLKHKKFCILNKQYTEDEYWPLIDQIKTEMLKRGEYGEFFPLSESPFAYNASYAQTLFPLTEKAVHDLGGRWHRFAEEIKAAQETNAQVPDRLDEVMDNILIQRFRCPETGRAFSFVKPELEVGTISHCPRPTQQPGE